MPDLDALEAAYEQAGLGDERPGFTIIWCDHCQCAHQATLKTNDICERVMADIREEQRRMALRYNRS